MTDTEWQTLERYVRQIADILGLKDWRIKVKRDVPDHDDANADVRVIPGRHYATVRFAADWRTEPPEEQRQNVAHEMIHCHIQQVSAVVEDDLYALRSISGTEFDIIKSAHHRAIEHATDAIAEAVAPFLPLIEWLAEDPAEACQITASAEVVDRAILRSIETKA